jgi:hypothetical protein
MAKNIRTEAPVKSPPWVTIDSPADLRNNWRAKGMLIARLFERGLPLPDWLKDGDAREVPHVDR